MTSPEPPAASVAPTDPAAWRPRVGWAVAGVVGLWAAIYLAVVLAFVLGRPAETPGPAGPQDGAPPAAHDGHGH
jgi:hypothetical protein